MALAPSLSIPAIITEEAKLIFEDASEDQQKSTDWFYFISTNIKLREYYEARHTDELANKGLIKYKAPIINDKKNVILGKNGKRYVVKTYKVEYRNPHTGHLMVRSSNHLFEREGFIKPIYSGPAWSSDTGSVMCYLQPYKEILPNKDKGECFALQIAKKYIKSKVIDCDTKQSNFVPTEYSSGDDKNEPALCDLDAVMHLDENQQLVCSKIPKEGNAVLASMELFNVGIMLSLIAGKTKKLDPKKVFTIHKLVGTAMILNGNNLYISHEKFVTAYHSSLEVGDAVRGLFGAVDRALIMTRQGSLLIRCMLLSSYNFSYDIKRIIDALVAYPDSKVNPPDFQCHVRQAHAIMLLMEVLMGNAVNLDSVVDHPFQTLGRPKEDILKATKDFILRDITVGPINNMTTKGDGQSELYHLFGDLILRNIIDEKPTHRKQLQVFINNITHTGVGLTWDGYDTDYLFDLLEGKLPDIRDFLKCWQGIEVVDSIHCKEWLEEQGKYGGL